MAIIIPREEPTNRGLIIGEKIMQWYPSPNRALAQLDNQQA